MKKKMRWFAVLSLTGAMVFTFGRVTSAIDLGDIIKGGAMALLIKQFDSQLNSFINTLLLNHKAENKNETKVVPIISFGKGGYLGAAQVIGQKSDVKQVDAVMQVEADFSGRKFRVKALIPVDSMNPTKISRVYGVGVSAVIDVKL